MMTPEIKKVPMKYNTTRPTLIIPEYGRNIQKMIDFAVTVEDRDERNKVANAIIKIMGQLNPHLRDVEEFNHKLWAHLFVMSDFKLDVDSPYPIPTKESFEEKPNPVAYPQNRIRFGHYGNTIQLFINAAIEYDEGEEKEALIKVIANLMKRTYLMYNRDSVEDEVIAEQLKILSKGKLELKDFSCLKSTQEINKMNGRSSQGGSKRNHKSNKNNRKRKKKY